MDMLNDMKTHEVFVGEIKIFSFVELMHKLVRIVGNLNELS